MILISTQNDYSMDRSNFVGTAGPVGASFAVQGSNWKCVSCGSSNVARRFACMRCRAKKQETKQVWDAASLSVVSGADHNWREALDPETKQLYYFNLKTKETKWERPAEMGQAPIATGWYGRGTGEAWKEKHDALNTEWLKRPAPKQAEPPSTKEIAYKEGSNEFNIWYGKYAGDNWRDGSMRNEPAKSRCKVTLHSGSTLADKRTTGTSYFCVMWVKGLCFKGSKCPFYHRLPTYGDCGVLEKDMMHDCFGRDRHASHRDDMGGTGSFNSDSRTLFVANLLRTPYADNENALKQVLINHFQEWGEIERVNVIWGKSIAFVRFRFRTHAELAKEAMAHQSLDHQEVLSVNWAHEDSNPMAREAVKRSNADAVVAAIKASGHTMKAAPFHQPVGYQPHIEDTDKAELAYPNTDNQYDAPVTKKPKH